MSKAKKQLGWGRFRAVRKANSDLVEISASGTLPCANFEAILERRPERIYPTQWNMIFVTADFCLKMRKDFSVSAYDTIPEGRANSIFIHDFRKPQEVKIENEAEIDDLQQLLSPDYFGVYVNLFSQDRQNRLVILPLSAPQVEMYQLVFGPDNFDNCKSWLDQNRASPAIQAIEPIAPWPWRGAVVE